MNKSTENLTIKQVGQRLQVITEEINQLQRKLFIKQKFSTSVRTPKMYTYNGLTERIDTLRREQDELAQFSASLFWYSH